MHFFKALLVVASAVSVSATSQTLRFIGRPTVAHVGEPIEIKYVAPSMSKPVQIALRKGADSKLVKIATLTNSATDGSFTWTPAKDLASGDDYTLEITQGSESNTTDEFALAGSNLVLATASGNPSGPSSYRRSPSSSASRARVTIAPSNVPSGPKGGQYIGSTMTSIPMPRNTTFVSPTLKPTHHAGGGGGGAVTTVVSVPAAPTPTGHNAASSLGAPVSVVVGLLLAAITHLL